jgi:ATP phosphoribosyltransferase regulatory subunit
MSDLSDKALLPAGMCDVLPPDAEREAAASESLIACFSSHGYDRVKPPLIEFEESLLGASGNAMSGQTFRLMDPVSQRMMGVRADMTLQVARIATTRLKNAPRPLRLCYGGQVLRISGTQMRPERQFGQVGSELLGSWQPEADAEVILMAIEALTDLGVEDLSVDLAIPTLVPALLAKSDLDEDTRATLRTALDRKDEAAVGALSGQLGGRVTEQLTTMLRATGPASVAIAALNNLELPENAAVERAALADVITQIGGAAPELSLTVDPVESRGLEYHTGVTFTIFAHGVRGELGGGGRYLAGSDNEPATGMTLFMDTVLRAVAPAETKKRLYLETATGNTEARKWRDEGWISLAALGENGEAKKQAMRLGCTHYLSNGKILPVKN